VYHRFSLLIDGGVQSNQKYDSIGLTKSNKLPGFLTTIQVVERLRVSTRRVQQNIGEEKLPPTKKIRGDRGIDELDQEEEVKNRKPGRPGSIIETHRFCQVSNPYVWGINFNSHTIKHLREKGLEPLRISPLDPKSSASTSSATLADVFPGLLVKALLFYFTSLSLQPLCFMADFTT
jgi:hypothetical protein